MNSLKINFMKRIFLFIYVTLMALIFCQCSSNDEEKALVTPDYNEHVEGFTSGRVSRKAPIYLLLSSDLDAARIKDLDANDFMSISPSIKGKFVFDDTHTIVFKAEEELKHNTTYIVTAKLDKLFDENAEDFKFSFQTYPFQLTSSLKSFEVSDNNEYIYNFNIHTLDEENVDVVKSLVSCSLGSAAKVEWSEENKLNYLMKVTVNSKNTDSDRLTLMVSQNKDLDLESEDLMVVNIPNSNKLNVFDIRYVTGETKYIEVIFNMNLDAKQDMKGMVYVGDNSYPVEVSKNVIKIYPSSIRSNSVMVHLSQNIRSKSGSLLGENYAKEVNIGNDRPSFEFLGNGTIIPQENKILIPFRSVFLKGVKVHVYKIYSHNIGQLLVTSDINGYNELGYVGRPIAVTTFFMDESYDLTQWHNYAIDITNLVKMDPGCIYRVELRMDQRLSAWPCDSVATYSKEIFEKEDEETMKSLNTRFNENMSYYYPTYDMDWDKFDYDEEDDPSKSSYYMRKYIGKNILATNIGLLAMAPSVNKLTVVATNIISAEAFSDVEIEVYNRQSHMISKGTTDSEGKADFVFDGNEGIPFYILAKKDNDISCLRVKRGEELSTSTFDVSGCEIQKGLKGYIYGERGVWRPGDTIHLSFMLNDREKTLPETHPVVMELSNPLGQLYKKMTKSKGQCGLYTFSIPTDPSVPTGSWLVNIQVGGTTFSKYLRVETIKPNRLKIDLKLPKVLNYGHQACKLHTEWMNGSKTHNLKYSIKANFNQKRTTFPNYEGFVFDNMSKSFSSREELIEESSVNDDGNGTVNFDLSVQQNAPGKLSCSVTTRLYEESGEFSTDTRTTEYSPYSRYVGIKAPKGCKYGYLETGSNHEYEVVVVSPEGEPVSNVPLHVEVKKVRYWWWWYSDSYSWADYSSSSYNESNSSYDIETNYKGRANFSLKYNDSEWGTYYIEVKDKEGKHSTSIKSYFDWPSLSSPRSRDDRENSITLSLSTNKEEYKPGEEATVTIPSTENGRAILTICNSAGIVDMKFAKCTKGQTSIKFKITEDMMPNAYICATLIQPYQHTENDVPIRLYGISPIRVTSEESKLNPQIIANDEVKPMTNYTVKVKEQNGRKMAYTLAIVDEGLLDLTHFETPNAWSTFNAKEALGLRIWDLYGHVCGAFGGKIDEMFSVGGDEEVNDDKKAVINRFTPMVYFKGPFVLEKGKTNTHDISIPNYTGRVRVMVVATDGAAYGSAEKSTFVRKPLMVTGTMPRQIGVNDEMTVSATIFAMDNSVKNVSTTLTCSDNMEIIGDNKIDIDFSEPGDKTIQFKVKAGPKGGTGRININSTCSNDKSSYITDITIRSVSQHLTKTETTKLEVGKSFNKTLKALGSEQQVIRMEVSTIQPLNMASRVSQLIGYPHGCAEQISSKGFSQLYLDEFSQLTSEQKSNIETNVKAVLNKLPNYQTNDGGMAYWPGSSYPDPWVSAYVLLFLDKAGEKGYLVNDKMKKNLINYVTTQVKNWKSSNYNYYDYYNYYDTDIAAFSLYALASINAPERGTMNRMKESSEKLSENDLNLLSASYALIGQTSTAKKILGKATDDNYYWHSPKVSRLIAQTLTNDQNAHETAELIRKDLISDSWMSTIETAMSFQAMYIYYKKNNAADELKFVANADNKEIANINSSAKSWNGIIAQDKNEVKASVNNKSNGTIFITTVTEGLAVQEPVPATTNGLSVKVSYQMDGSIISLDSIPQGASVKAVITVNNNTNKTINNVAITHILPSGFETLSTDNSSNVNYQDIRDDRVLSYVNEFRKGRQVVITLTLSATYAGSYYVPAVAAEAMYDNKIFGCSNSGQCVVK